MKYFKNITTPEELKKQFRALSIKLHPDRPTGNAEEFSPFSNYSGTGASPLLFVRYIRFLELVLRLRMFCRIAYNNHVERNEVVGQIHNF